jgi:hypothetical protein
MDNEIEHTDYSELIEKYIDGELSNEEKISFEKKLHSNKELSQQYRARLQLASMLKGASEYKNTKDNISNILQKEQIKQFPFRMVISIAAVLILFLGIYIILKNNTNQKEDIQIAKSDSVKVYKPVSSRSKHFGTAGYFRPFSNVDPNTIVKIEIVTDSISIIKNSGYQYKLSVEFSATPDSVKLFSFSSEKKIVSAKYIYLNDSLIQRNLFYKFRSVKSKNNTFFINADSIRVNLPYN